MSLALRIWSFQGHLGRNSAFPKKASFNNQERERKETLSTPSSAIICYPLTLPGQAVDQNLLKGVWQTDKLLITLRSRGTDPHPAAGADPPPGPTLTPPSRVSAAEPWEGHACDRDLPEEETLHRERAGTSWPEQLRNLTKAQFIWNSSFSDDNLLYFWLPWHDRRVILDRWQQHAVFL